MGLFWTSRTTTAARRSPFIYLCKWHYQLLGPYYRATGHNNYGREAPPLFLKLLVQLASIKNGSLLDNWELRPRSGRLLLLGKKYQLMGHD